MWTRSDKTGTTLETVRRVSYTEIHVISPLPTKVRVHIIELCGAGEKRHGHCLCLEPVGKVNPIFHGIGQLSLLGTQLQTGQAVCSVGFSRAHKVTLDRRRENLASVFLHCTHAANHMLIHVWLIFSNVEVFIQRKL